MALSDYEKHVLAEMEQHLRKQDPDLADAMASSLPEKEETVPEKKQLSPRRIALGSILVAVGLAVVLIGMTIQFVVWTIVLGALGFIMMVGGVLYALSPDKKAPPVSSTKAGGATPGKPKLTREERDEQRRNRWQNRGSA